MWYREGTFTLTPGSRTVTGVGTKWAQASKGVMPGMILLAPDFTLHEIQAVASDTELTLVENYTGTLQSGKPCRIITTYEGDITQFSARFAATLAEIRKCSDVWSEWTQSDGIVEIVNVDGSLVKVDSLPKIVREQAERAAWFDVNIPVISAAGDRAREAAASAVAAKTSETNAKTSENAAKASQTAAKTSETNAKTSETNAATSKTAASTSETNALASKNAAAASQTAAKSSEDKAKLSETAAKSSEDKAKLSETAAATSETNAAASKTAAGTSEANALASKNAAAASQTAAKTSETNAKTSETNAAASKTAAGTSETNALASKNAAAASQTAAKSSEDKAKLSETAAKSSEDKAKLSETAASASEVNAATSETNALASKNAAAASQTAAKSSEDKAKLSETAAAGSATSALASKNAAATSETNSAASAASALASKNAAGVSETNAAASKTAAGTSETNALASKNAAAASQTAAKASEDKAKLSETAAAASAADADTSKAAAAASQTAAKTSETNAGTSRTAAAASQTAAKTSETNAKASENAAKTSETNAGTSATASAASATESADSATVANTAKVAAAASQTAAKTSETNSKTSETNAASSRTAAAASQTAAKTSETNAKTSETNAKASELAARAAADEASAGALPIGGGTITGNLIVQGLLTVGSYASFDDRYLSLSGNAASAAKLAVARTIGGVAFDGTANINLPGVNTAGNQNTTGNAATATKLATARTLTLGSTGKAFDGTANVAWTIAEMGAAPTGHGLGTYAGSVADVFQDLRTKCGFYNASNAVDQPDITGGHTWKYYFNAAHGNASGYNGTIAIDFNGVGMAFRAVAAGVDKGWKYVYHTGNKPGFADVGAPSVKGENANGTWGIGISGNAGSATKLATARTFTLGNTGKAFDGTANVSFTLAELGALPLAGGTLTGNLSAPSLTATANSVYVKGSGNVHYWFQNQDGTEKAVIWASDDQLNMRSSKGTLVLNGTNWANAWPHSYAQQYGTIAPVHVDFGTVNGASDYYPMIRGRSTASGHGYTGDVDLGVLRSGNAAWPVGVIRVGAAESHQTANTYCYQFTCDGTVSLANVNAAGTIKTPNTVEGGWLHSTGDMHVDRNAYAAHFHSHAGAYLTGNLDVNDVYIRSDITVKKDIQRIENALDKLETITGNTYLLEQPDGSYAPSAGLIAQEVQIPLPELVTKDDDEDGLLRLNYNGMIGVLVEALKELRGEVREIKGKVDDLEAALAAKGGA